MTPVRAHEEVSSVEVNGVCWTLDEAVQPPIKSNLKLLFGDDVASPPPTQVLYLYTNIFHYSELESVRLIQVEWVELG